MLMPRSTSFQVTGVETVAFGLCREGWRVGVGFFFVLDSAVRRAALVLRIFRKLPPFFLA